MPFYDAEEVAVEKGQGLPAEATSPNIFIGTGAGSTVAAKSEANVALGYKALVEVTKGSKNVALGAEALETITAGEANIGIGWKAGGGNKTGGSNISIGAEAGVTTGGLNITMGYQAGKELVGANEFNTLIGHITMLKATKENTALGYKAGEKVTGAANVMIGFEAGASLEAVTGKLAIANNSSVNIIEGVMSATAASNELKLGTTGGKVGLYGTAPKEKFAEITVPGAYKVGVAAFETEAEAKAIRDKLTTVIEALKNIGVCV